MSQVKMNAFLADAAALKRASRFTHPRMNINDRFGTRTSIKGLLTHLGNTYGAPQPMTLSEALAHCLLPTDQRIVKYMPAIHRLVACWGRGAPYPAITASTEARNKAMWKFALALRNWPPGLAAALPSWDDMEGHASAFAFTSGLGPGYLHRVQVHGQPNLDITARSLLLRSGLGPPSTNMLDHCYIHCLGLTQNDFNAMAGRSILDVGCGGALFGAEMAAAYGCATDGLDMNSAHVGAAVAEGQRRYAKSMMYLKMLKDLHTPGVSDTPGWSGPVVDRLADNLAAILQYYAANLPNNGDILAAPNAFQLAANAIRPAGWDYTTCMFVLCYFDAADQTDAVLNMCSVTNRAVLLFSGGGAVPHPQLEYDPVAVRAAHPNCTIVELDEQTHHIRL
jgi:SAM-dependent methyltransferase